MNIDLQLGDGKRNVFTPSFSYLKSDIIVIINAQPVEFTITPRGGISLEIIPAKGTLVILTENKDFYQLVEQLLLIGLKAFDKKTAKAAIDKMTVLDGFFQASELNLKEAKKIETDLITKLSTFSDTELSVSKKVNSLKKIEESISDKARVAGNLLQQAEQQIITLQQKATEFLNKLNNQEAIINNLDKKVTTATDNFKEKVTNVADDFDLEIESKKQDLNEILQQARDVQDRANQMSAYLDNLFSKPITAKITIPPLEVS